MRELQRKSLLSKIKEVTLVGLLALPLACGGSGYVPPEDPSEPGAPGWIGSHLDSLQENENYSSDSAIAIDPEGDSVNYSIVSAPDWLQINSLDGYLSNSRALNDLDVGNQSVTLNASDGTLSTDYAFNIDVKNVSTLSGNVKEMGVIDKNLGGITVKINATNSVITDSNGDWSIQGVPDGNYYLFFKDTNPMPEYETYWHSFNFTTNQTQENEENLTGLEHKLFRKDDLQFINDTIRHNGEIRKWKTKPVFNIYTLESTTGDLVDHTGLVNTIKSELSQFCSDTYNFTDLDINIINETNPEGTLINGVIKLYWSDSGGEGGNWSDFNGNEIIKAYSHFSRSVGKNVWLQELVENMIGSGETTDSNYINSCLYSTTLSESLSSDDLKLSDAVYSIHARPAGNYDNETTDPDSHDINPN